MLTNRKIIGGVITFVLIGVILLFCASKLDPYKDAKAVEKAMFDYPGENEDSYEASKRYWAVRDAQLTPKYGLEDYGKGTLIIAILLFLLLPIFKVQHIDNLKDIRAPKRVWMVLLFGLVAGILEPIAYETSLYIDQMRGEFPPWADSLAIPLMYVPYVFQQFLGVTIVFSVIGSIKYHGGMKIVKTLKKPSRPHFIWHILLGVPTSLSIVYFIFCVVYGEFLSILPAFFWVMFFISLYAGRQKTREKISCVDSNPLLLA